ncbi:bcl-2-like protein 10 [Erpetoichthys calabaricus]|uniref:BCL2 like 10 n=1 Tax=Erpetoichthys calabaricus TaxID=27687 RepID=A0A8C4T7P8_ERPCA|nr:bcl-2-like protein 10 [Erpetoichthys calabaricus]
MPCYRKETYEVAKGYIDHCIGVQRAPPSETVQIMCSLAKEMEKTYQHKLNSLLQNFISCCTPDYGVKLKRVMEEMVGDGILNWGRIVSLFTFTGLLAQELHSKGAGTDCSNKLADTIADYLGVEKAEWLAQNGGWDGFSKYFQNSKDSHSDSSMKTALFAAAGFGIAGLAILLVR